MRYTDKINWFLIFLMCLSLLIFIQITIHYENTQQKLIEQMNRQQQDLDELFLRTDELFKRKKERGSAL